MDFFRSITKTYHNKSYPFISPTRPNLTTKGKTAVVTGAGQGVGAAIALSLAKSGISAIALLGRTEKTLQDTKRKIETVSPNTKAEVYGADIVDAEAIFKALNEFAASIHGGIDILVANAGWLPPLASIPDADPDEWWRGFEINVRGNFNLLRAYLPHSSAGGVAVHVSSSAMHIPYMPGYSSYRGSKIAATKVFEIFGRENAGRLRTVQIHPGLVDTALADRFRDGINSVRGVVWDDPALAGDFVNWVISDEAAFLDGKFVWANWDAQELVEMKGRIQGDDKMLTLNLIGWA